MIAKHSTNNAKTEPDMALVASGTEDAAEVKLISAATRALLRMSGVAENLLEQEAPTHNNIR